MPQSLSAVYVHLVFSTLDRNPSITEDHLGELHAYLGGTANRLGCTWSAVNGVADHVHMLVRLGRQLTIADLVRDVKSNSSGWMKSRGSSFAWQRGYGAFSFGEKELPALREYLAKQAEHHKRVSFQEEYRELLRAHNIEVDERYLWE